MRGAVARGSVGVIAALLAGSTLAARRAKVAPAPATAPALLTPAQSIRAGVEKWRAGAYPEAVALWTPFAATGDPDAMFNMGQAYKLGRGVAADPMIARDYYRKAAAKGHLPAQANLGISLFQTGEKPEAVRWLRQAADRGEARAQYVLGIATFNGDGPPRAAGLGYGYLLRSAASGLPQAAAALRTIEPGLSSADRAIGEVVAASLASGKGVPVALAMASGPRMITSPPPPSTTLLRVVPPIATPPLIKAPPPPSAPLSVVTVLGAFKPDVAVPERVVPRATFPATKAAAAPVAPPAPKPATGPAPKPVIKTTTENAAKPAVKIIAENAPPRLFTTPATETAAVKHADSWRVQLGAFSQRQLADAAWAQIKSNVTAGVKPIFATDGPVTKLQLGPYSTRESARSACAMLSVAGRACFVTAG